MKRRWVQIIAVLVAIYFPLAAWGIPPSPKVPDSWTLLGTSTRGATSLGAFTGSTIPDTNTDITEALQALETAVEGLPGGHDAVTIASGIGSLTLSTQELSVNARIEAIADFVDPNADRLWFWDDSASAFTGLTVGSGLAITDTTIATDATLTALAALTIQDASVIQGTGADAFAVLASGGNNYILGSNSDNSALEFKTPANVLSQIGAQASNANLAAIAGLTLADVSVIEGTGSAAAAVVSSGGALRYLRSNSDNSALEFADLDADLTTIAELTTTRGDLMYVSSGGSWADLAVGSANTVLTTNGTDPAWSTVTSAMITNDTITATDLAAALTFAEGDSIDLSGITMSTGVDEGIALPTYADVVPASSSKFWIAYDPDNNVLMVRESGGWINASAGSGAATTLNFVTTQAEGALSTESVLSSSSGGTGITVADAGGDGGAITIAFAPTELGNVTWGAGSAASLVWTMDLSGTDHTVTFGSDLTTLSGSLTVATGKNITLGTTQWNSSDKIDGEQIADDTIDDDSIDWSDVTAADITLTDAGIITASGLITGNAGVTVATGQHLTIGTTQWDNGSDKINGEQIADDTIDDDSIDFGSGTDQVGVADLETGETINILLETEIDASSELATLMDDETGSGALVFGTSPTFTTSVNMGTVSSKTDVTMHDAGTIVFDDDGDNTSVTFGPVGDGTTVLAITGTLNATGLQVGGSAVLNVASTWTGGDLGGTGLAPTVTDLTISGEAQGEVLYYNGTNWASLDVGTNGKVLTTHGAGASPTWETVSASAAGDGSPAGQVQYEASGMFSAEDAFYYTAATNLLTVGNVQTSGYLSTGAAAADAGEIRMSNTDTIEWEAAPAGTNVTIGTTADEDLVLTVAATDYVQVATGNLRVGGGTPGQTLDGGDAYVSGILEVDGAIYADGGIIAAASATPYMLFSDSDATSVGTGDIKVDSYTGGYDSLLRMYVDDSTGEDTLYVTVDGTNEEVLFAKKIDLTSTGIENVGNISDDASFTITGTDAATVTVDGLVISAGAVTSLVSITDGTASWSSSALSGFSNVTATKITSTELEFTGNISIDAINAAGASTVTIANSNGSYVANVDIEGDLDISGGDITVDGSEEVLTLVDAASANNNIQITNAANSASPSIVAIGSSDSNVGISIDAKGAGEIAIGSADAKFSVASDALDISNAGALSGVTTIGMSGDLTLGADDDIANIVIHDAGTITMYDDSDDTSVQIGPVTNGTTTLGITGKVAASAGVDLGTSQALTGTTAMTIGDNNQTVAVNSSDWDIGATGDMTGIGSIALNGDFTLYDAVNDGNPVVSVGSGANERLTITATYEGGGQLLESVTFNTTTTDDNADDGEMIFQVDDVEIARFKDSGPAFALVSTFATSADPDSDGGATLGTKNTAEWQNLYLNTGGTIEFENGDLTLTHSANTLTLGGGTLALGSNNLTMTGSIGETGSRVTKGWFTDLEVTNAIAGSVTGNAGTATALAADPSNCTAGQIALGVNASGVAECTATPSGLTSVGATTFTGALTGTASGNLALTGGTLTGNVILDDGTGNSPTITLTDATDETVVFEKVDSGYLTFTTVAADGVNVLVGNVKIGDGFPGQTIDGEDLYVNGLVEIDGVLNADGGFISGAQNKLYSANADPTGTAGYILHDATVANHANGALRWHDGTNIRQVVDMVAATVEACTDDQVVAYDADADLFYCKADADTGGATALNAIGDAAADGEIATTGYETVITSTLDEADHSVLKIINTDADRGNDTTILTLSDNDGADANAFYLKLIGDADGTPATYLSISQTTVLSGALAWDLGGATSFELPNSDDPDIDATGEISFDTDGWLRVYETSQKALARIQEEIHVTVVKPQDMADAVRDAFLVWSNESGMTFTVTGWKAWSGTDNTTLNIETTDGTGGTNATVDAVEIASDGTGCFYASDTTITAATIANGSLIWLDFDDSDDPTYVKLVIYGYYNADVN